MQISGKNAAPLKVLEAEVVSCRRCPRLVEYRERIGCEKRRAYLNCDYWARPVPGFGDPHARVLVLGLAPGAHGSNRTGRPFTGDASGKFMFPVLHRLGFASQPDALSRDDGMQLHNLWITAAVRCAPPDNKPLPSEIANCADYTDREIAALDKLKVVVALGKIAFDAYLDAVRRQGVITRKSAYLFGHAAEYPMPNGIILLASYHPSNQNTATGKLTSAMFESVFARAQELAIACERGKRERKVE
jgi:uracil-DNA glycosylase family 4